MKGDLESVLKKCGTIPEAEAGKILKHIINGFKEQIKKGLSVNMICRHYP